MIQDLRFALRLFTRSPGFTLLAVFSLAAAIGVNSGIFAIVDAAFLRPFIAHRPEEVVNVFTARQGADRDFRQFSYPEFLTLAESNDVFAELGAVEYATVGLGLGETVRRSFAFLVTDGYFRVQGVAPAQGRLFTAEESRANAAIPLAVLSDALWRRLGQPAVGHALRLNGQLFTVVGVMPRTFSGGNAVLGPELWLPLGARDLVNSSLDGQRAGLPLDHPRAFELNLVARLQPGMSQAAATVRLPALATRLDTLKADPSAGPRTLFLQAPPRINLNTAPSDERGLGTYAALLLALAGAVLLIACLNLANLMLARGTARTREFALRAAVGATRWNLIRQLLVEGMALSLAGGALGLLLATWANDWLLGSIAQALSTLHFAIVLPLAPDARIVAVTFGFCTLATLLFALLPAWRLSRLDLAADLKSQGREARDHHALSRFFAPRQLLVMGQLALALMLLFGAGLFLRGLLAAAHLAPGFDPRGGLVAEVDYTLLHLERPAMRQRAVETLGRVAALPGVRQAALASLVPFGPANDSRRLGAVGGALDPEGKPQTVSGLFTAVSASYFSTLGVPVLRGREFTAAEAADPAARVLMLDESMAQKLFPDRDALGQQVQFSTPEADGSRPEYQVVGIVAPHRHDLLAGKAPKRIFTPLAQGFAGNVFLHVRLAHDDAAATATFLPVLRTALRQGDPHLPLLELRTFEDILETNIGIWVVRLGAILFGLFGTIALVLAVAGVYGVKAYAVARRRREIGIRMAVGAQKSDVLRLFLGQGARQTAFALACGLPLTLLVGQAISAMLHSVNPFDPLVLGVATAVLATTAILATWLPARRATRIDPVIALRAE